MKKVPFGCNLSPSSTKKVSSLRMYYPRCPNIMEGYIASGCHMGTRRYPSTIFSSLAFKTMLIYKGEIMLGSYPKSIKYIERLLYIEAISIK